MSATGPAAPMWTDRPARFWDPATPVHFDAEAGGWHVFGYDDVKALLSDTETFACSLLSDEERRQADPLLVGFWEADGERHRALRAAVAEPFRRSALRAIEGEITHVAVDLLDGVTAAGTGELEIVESLARPLPSRVICRLLGVETRYADLMHEWREVIHERSEGVYDFASPPQMREVLGELIELRRAHPEPGLLDDLLATQADGYVVDGRRLDDWELIGYLAMFLWAAYATTATSMADAFLFLAEHGHWDELAARPELVPGAVEETLRWYPGFPACHRYATRDVSIGGVRIGQGEHVIGWLTSANRDPAKFADPDRFDVARHPNAHIGFGAGPHVCLGAALARIELRAMIREASKRLPGLRLDTEQPVRRKVWIEDSIEEAHFTYDVRGETRSQPRRSQA